VGTFGAAWATMGVAFGFHVIDEAATDFLASLACERLLETRTIRLEPLDQGASRRRVAGSDNGISSN